MKHLFATTLMGIGITLAVVVALAGGVAPAQAASNDCLHRGPHDPLDDGAQAGRNGIVRFHPGYPCAPFQNRARVILRVRKLLLYNGYRQAGMVVYAPPRNWRTGRLGTGSDRQIVMSAIQDGYRYTVKVLKTGSRQIFVQAVTLIDIGYGHGLVSRGGRLYGTNHGRLNLGFTA
jgi:hypothetical protein